jgi:transposase
MEISEEQYRKIQDLLPKQRGRLKIENLTLLNALVYRCENGCKWRALPEKFGRLIGMERFLRIRRQSRRIQTRAWQGKKWETSDREE